MSNAAAGARARIHRPSSISTDLGRGLLRGVHPDQPGGSGRADLGRDLLGPRGLRAPRPKPERPQKALTEGAEGAPVVPS